MNHKLLLILSMGILLITGCGQQEREQNLVSREKQVREQQQELILKANQLALKEKQLEEKEKHLDSALIGQDSIAAAFPKLAGTWNVNMICSQATCAGSAVGDTKNEQWVFSLQGSSIIAQAYTKKVLSRVYIGKYRDGLLQLTAQAADATIESNIQMNVFLRPIADSTSMSGKRNITRPDCQIVYNMNMKKL